MQQVESLEALLESGSLSPESLSEVKRILYGKALPALPISEYAAVLAEKHNFEVKAFKVEAATEQVRGLHSLKAKFFFCVLLTRDQLRKPRIVRIGAVQNSIVLPTTAPFAEQYNALEAKIGNIIDAAADMEVNVLCLQEAWTMPFAFCTREVRREEGKLSD